MDSMEQSRTKICPQCKRAVDYYDLKCVMCGHEFELPEYEDERCPYIEKKIDTYLRKFESLERRNSKSGWNWCAFLFGSLWMAYRKMYRLCILFFILEFAIPFVFVFAVAIWLESMPMDPEKVALILEGIEAIVSLGICIVCGLLGDHWYRKRIRRLVEEGSVLPEKQRQKHIMTTGGTSSLAVVGLLTLNLVIIVMVL